MRKTIYITVALWTLSLLLAVPDLISTYVNTSGQVPYCDAYHYWGGWYVKFRTMFRFIVLFVCPLIVITVFYAAITCTLLRRSRDSVGTVCDGEPAMRQLNSRRKVSMPAQYTASCIILSCILVLY